MEHLSDDPVDRLEGVAPAIRALREQIRHLAAFDAVGGVMVPTVLLQGETGTGKGLVARIIHDSGPRARGPFVPVNCAAIPDTMLEAELFGYEPGAFTGATRGKPGLFEAAAGGTLFLDEIDSLSPALQAKLLTAIESKRIRRLGAVAEQTVDVKLLAATQQDLGRLAQEGRFRADLYHRLAVVVLTLPPLRDRDDDVVLLASGLLDRFAAGYGVPSKTLTPEGKQWLRRYGWPGNVRELGHLAERATLLHADGALDARDLDRLARPTASPTPPSPDAFSRDAPSPPDEAEEVRQALARSGGNVVKAARILGVSRDTVRYRMRRYGIERPRLAEALPHRNRPSVGPGAENCGTPRVRSLSQPGAEPSHPAAPAREPSPTPSLWEQKTVAVLAIDLTWPDAAEPGLPVHEPWTEAERWGRVIREKLEGLGGTLLQQSPALLIWAFGIPRGLEQLPERLVHGALAIGHLVAGLTPRQRAPELRLAMHIGAMFVDPAAADPALRALPAGETLSVPVRLLGDAGPGEIVASAEVARRVASWVRLAPIETHTLAGRPRRTTASRVLGLKPWRERRMVGRGRSLAPFVGRERELEMLSAAISAVTAGSGQLVGIVGDPGSGKSRLLFELQQLLRDEPVRYAEGHCLAHARMTPYFPLVEMLKSYFDVQEADESGAIRDRVRARLTGLGLDPDVQGPYILDLVGPAGEVRPADGVDRETVKRRTFEAIHGMTFALARQQPLVLALENVHWIDPSTEECLTALAERLGGVPCLLVMTYRPGYRPAWLDKSYAMQIALRPLGLDESRRLVRSVSVETPLPPAVEDQLLAIAQGNPFFLEELVRSIQEQGTTARTFVEQGSQIGLAVPDTIQAVLSTRIDRLALADKQLLQAASVIGTRIPVGLLAAVSGLEREALEASLARLQAAEFLYERPSVVGPTFQFRHALTHDAIYESLNRERRRSLHARAAAALADIDPDPPDDRVDQLAQHALHGELWERAAVLLRRAGAAAMARSAHREAALRFEQALRALERLAIERDTRAESIDVRLELRNALVPLGESSRIVSEMDRAEAAARALGDQPRLALIASYTTRQLFLMGDHERAIASGRRALAAAGDHLPTRIATNLYLGYAYDALGDYRRAIDALGDSVRHLTGPRRYEHSGLAPLPAVSAGSRLAQCCAELGEFPRGEAHGEEALEIAETAGHTISLIQACRGLGVLCLRKGELDRAEALLGRGFMLSREAGLPLELPVIASALGSVHLHAGRREKALELLEQAVEQARVLKRVDQQALRLVALGAGYLASGRLEDAWALFRDAMESARAQKERGAEAYALRLGGALVAAGGPGDEGSADDLYRRAMATAESLAMRPLVALCRLDLGRHLARLGHVAAARNELVLAADGLRSLRMAFWLREADQALGTG